MISHAMSFLQDAGRNRRAVKAWSAAGAMGRAVHNRSLLTSTAMGFCRIQLRKAGANR